MSFTKLGVVIPLGSAGDFDVVRAWYPSAIVRDGRVWLYYTGRVNGDYYVGLAVSDDGIHFTKLGVVLPLGTAGDFDTQRIDQCCVIVRDGRVWLYYSAHDGATYRVGLAVSDDGIHFTKLGVVLPLGAGGDFDDVYVHTPGVVIYNSKIYVYYAGYDGSSYRIGAAVSASGH